MLYPMIAKSEASRQNLILQGFMVLQPPLTLGTTKTKTLTLQSVLSPLTTNSHGNGSIATLSAAASRDFFDGKNQLFLRPRRVSLGAGNANRERRTHTWFAFNLNRTSK